MKIQRAADSRSTALFFILPPFITSRFCSDISHDPSVRSFASCIKPAAYLVPAKTYEMSHFQNDASPHNSAIMQRQDRSKRGVLKLAVMIMDKIENDELAQIIEECEPEKKHAVKVNIDEL